jgi:hypothetical protein
MDFSLFIAVKLVRLLVFKEFITDQMDELNQQSFDVSFKIMWRNAKFEHLRVFTQP